MSRIGLQPITLPRDVTVTAADDGLLVRGPQGEWRLPVPDFLDVRQDGGTVTVERRNDRAHSRAMHGTFRSLLANSVEGVSKGFERALTIEGVGYRAAVQGTTLVLSLGYSHEIRFDVPEGIEVKLDGQTSLSISGVDKQQVGQVAARIRSFSPAEPYKGKGVRYKGEQIRRKAGKAVS
jgi:large subunit ribosomal protein L6